MGDATGPPRRKGRKPKLAVDPAAARRICDAVAIGASYELAAKYGGICYTTLDDWRRKFPDFARQMDDAEGRAGVGWLAKIEKAANDGTWQAAAWKLERRYPATYGRTVQEQRHADADGRPLRFTIAIDRRDPEPDAPD